MQHFTTIWLISQEKNDRIFTDVGLDRKSPLNFVSHLDLDFEYRLRIWTRFALEEVCTLHYLNALVSDCELSVNCLCSSPQLCFYCSSQLNYFSCMFV